MIDDQRNESDGHLQHGWIGLRLSSALCSEDSQIATVEIANVQLCKENEEFKEKVEWLESHSRKYNLQVFSLVADIKKENLKLKDLTF